MYDSHPCTYITVPSLSVFHALFLRTQKNIQVASSRNQQPKLPNPIENCLFNEPSISRTNSYLGRIAKPPPPPPPPHTTAYDLLKIRKTRNTQTPPSTPIYPLHISHTNPSKVWEEKMCQITPTTTHACGHARTAALITRCAKSLATGLGCPSPPPTVMADSKCWSCLGAQIGESQLAKLFVESLVVPETTVIEGRVEEEWMDVYTREREEKARARRREAEKAAAQVSTQ